MTPASFARWRAASWKECNSRFPRRDGAQALDMCRKVLPDAVLLDLNMPKMDGMTFLKEMRNLPGGSHPKVVFCTIENDIAHITRVLRAGADEYIMKPFDKEIVEAKFQRVGFG